MDKHAVPAFGGMAIIIQSSRGILGRDSKEGSLYVGAGHAGCVIIKDCHSPGYFGREATGKCEAFCKSGGFCNLPFSINNLRIHENIKHELI